MSRDLFRQAWLNFSNLVWGGGGNVRGRVRHQIDRTNSSTSNSVPAEYLCVALHTTFQQLLQDPLHAYKFKCIGYLDIPAKMCMVMSMKERNCNMFSKRFGV